MMRTANERLFEDYLTYAVATPTNAPHLDRAPFDVPIHAVIDPLKVSSGPFLERLQRLDALCFGPEGMPMDKWVFYDCAELPGFTYGFATPVEKLSADERAAFRLTDDATGLVPLSVYITIPMYETDNWFGHNLSSLNRTFASRDMHHLASITKAMALKAFKVKHFVGATQWRSNALHIHTRFGPLRLDTAYTPAHSTAETLTYSMDVTDEALRAAMGDPGVTLARPAADFELDADDVDAMKRLQREIEAGAGYLLVDRPRMVGKRRLHPIARCD